MTFARSNRSTRSLAGAGLAVGALLACATGLLLWAGDLPGALLAAMLAAVALGAFARMARRLRRWPASRLAFFRDRLVLVQGRTELQALWDRIELVSLADLSEWGTSRWPEISLTDRLTLRLRRDRCFSFRPAAFGVDPVACRDAILRLRDNRLLRGRLPEFDSVLDLSSRPVQTGEQIRPNI